MTIVTESVSNTQVEGYRIKIEDYSGRLLKNQKRSEKYLFFSIIAVILGALFIGSVFFAKILLPELSKDELSYRNPPVHKVISIPQPQIAQAQPLEITPAVIPPPASKPVPVFETLPVVMRPPELILNGIMYDKAAPYAIVNNQILQRGMEIEGATLVQINKESVKFRFHDKEFDLRLKW